MDLNEEQIRSCVIKLISKITDDLFYPDVIVGLSRGGLIPAQYLAYGMKVKHVETMSIQLRDSVGLSATEEMNDLLIKLIIKFKNIKFKNNKSKNIKSKLNILVVDDLVDSGETIKLIHTFFEQDEFNIKTAVLYQEPNNEIIRTAHYWGEVKPEGWLNFPWDTLSV